MVKLTKLRKEDFESILSNYSIGKCVSHKHITKAFENTVYFVKTTKGKFVLKVFEQAKEKDVRNQTKMQEDLARKNNPVPSIIKNNKGNSVCHFKNKSVQIQEFSDGKRVKLNDTLIRQYGKVIGKIDYDLKEQKYKIIEQREKLVELGRKDREQGEESRKEQALGYTTQQGILNSLIEHETHLTGKLENKRNKVKELQAEYDKFYKFLIENKTIEDKLIEKKKLKDFYTKEEIKDLDKINEQIRTYNELMETDLKPLAPVDVENIEEAKGLILELGTVYEQVFARRKEQHEANKEMELKGAALSGNTAIGAMKNVVSAELMEAIAGLLASILKSVPFPLNLLVAAGAGGLAKGLMDKALGGIKDKFASGGSMMVTGSGGADSQTIPIRVSPGERATTIIETPQQINNNNNVQIIGDFTITGRDLHYVLKKYEDDTL